MADVTLENLQSFMNQRDALLNECDALRAQVATLQHQLSKPPPPAPAAPGTARSMELLDTITDHSNRNSSGVFSHIEILRAHLKGG